MILYVFRGQYLIRYIFLLLLTIILWGDALLFPEKLISAGSYPGFGYFHRWLEAAPFISTVVTVFLLYFQALILNAVAGNNRLVERNQLIVAAIYILMMSSTQTLVQPHIFILINFLIILQFNTVLRFYGRSEPFGALFDAGLIAGISTLFFYPSIVFLLIIFYALVTFGLFRWREWLIPAIGFLTPFMFVATWFFWFDQLTTKTQIWMDQFRFSLPSFPEITTAEWLIPVLFALLFIMGMVKIFQRANESTVDIRKKYRITFFLLLIAAVMPFLPLIDIRLQGAVAIIPLSVILSSYVSAVKTTLYVELIFSLIILVILSTKVLQLI
jgi:hypothetical protein